MGKGECIACWIGAVLTGASIYLMTNPSVLASLRTRSSKTKEGVSTEKLAETLKEAWADRHTP